MPSHERSARHNGHTKARQDGIEAAPEDGRAPGGHCPPPASRSPFPAPTSGLRRGNLFQRNDTRLSTSLHPIKALKHPLYELLVVEPGMRHRSSFLIPSLEGRLRELGFDPGMVTLSRCSTNLPGAPSPDTYRSALYLAPSDPAEAAEAPTLLKDLLAQDIPVLPLVSDLRRASAVLPSDLAHLNALEWPEAPPEAPAAPPVLDILRFAGLSESDRRVFISYKRSEASAVAEQLLDALRRRRFDVFLDLYSIDHGESFQAALKAELVSRAMVVLLQSPGIGESQWVMEEVHCAQANKLGLLAVAWPGSDPSRHPRLRFLPGDYYHPLHSQAHGIAGDFDSDGSGRLTPDALHRLVQRIEEAHAHAMTRRRREMVGSLTAALRQHAVPFQPSGAWGVIATPVRPGHGSIRFDVLPRPATAEALFECEVRRRRHPATPAACLVQPVTTIPGHHAAMVKWITCGKAVSCAAETEIQPLVRQLAATVPSTAP